MKVPGMNPGNVCDRPVDMVNVFPTLISLCGLPPKSGLDGHDLTPLLKNPQTEWNYPAITEIQVGNVAIRSQDWRYIRYNDGGEELYDRKNDPHEWVNLVRDEKYREVIEAHRKWVPVSFAKPVPVRESYYFDPATFTFMNRETGEFIDGKK
jgi:iduronate 2-sulfatase